MTLLLTLEQGPRAQAMRQARLDEGELVIGRGSDADWQIEDPDMFVSRAHCRIAARDGGYFITDTSSSGLYIDSSSSPLGAGNTARLQQGMRLRLGDYVLWVEAATFASRAPMEASKTAAGVRDSRTSSGGLQRDDFFSMSTPEVPQPRRPEGLPSPFEDPKPGAFQAYERADGNRSSPAFDDPFSLDPVATPFDDKVEAPARRTDPFGFDADPTPSPFATPSTGKRSSIAGSFDDDFGFGSPPNSIEPELDAFRASVNTPEPPTPARPPWELSPDDESIPPPVAKAPSGPSPKASRERRGPSLPKAAQLDTSGGRGDSAGAHEAFLRGLGLDEEGMRGRDPVTEMERFGREYRLMMDGLMQLLRKRAEEKGNARIAQTVVGSSGVNPLKFLPTVDDALATILADHSPGFLGGEAAISDAVRDLAQHHVRAWRGVQAALRRMTDRFDPAAIEEELKSGSSIGTLLTGGRGAKLWELYQKRHREIAQNAETRFLGDIGADFRDAYEEE